SAGVVCARRRLVRGAGLRAARPRRPRHARGPRQHRRRRQHPNPARHLRRPPAGVAVRGEPARGTGGRGAQRGTGRRRRRWRRFLRQSGRLTGLTGLKRGRGLDLTPEFTSKVDGTPAAAGSDYRGTPELGGNLRCGITQNLGLCATAHPDFSQVEADVGQVTVNERFALFYPEKRPFFLEGLEQFDTPNRLIYTRQIAQPVAGAKLTGKVGGTAVAYLAAVDDQTRSAARANPVFNLLRLRHDLGASSTAGLVYTDRIDGGDYNRVLGGDGM